MAKAKSRDAGARSGGMSLEKRLSNYAATGRTGLTPRQLRRAAHKAKISTAEVLERSAKA